MTRSSSLWRYALAAGAVALALGLSVLVERLGNHIFVAPFIGAVLIAAWFGGRGPGWLAVILSTLAADYLWLPPFGATEISPQAIFFFAGFVVCAAAANWLSTWRRQVEASLQLARDEMQAKVEERTAELRKSEEQWRDVFENNPTMYLMLDGNSIIVSVNPLGAEQLGYSVAELAGRSVLDFIHPGDRETARRNIAGCLGQIGQARCWEIRNARKDGTVLWVRQTAKAVAREQEPIVLVACEDITERKRSEKALREQSSLLNLTHDSIFVRGMGDVITYWNRGAEELYGWTAQEAVGKVSHQLMNTVFPASLDEIQAKLLRTGRWEGELVHSRADGSKVVVASRWSLQRDEQGRPVAVLETNNDISAAKQAEDRLRRSEAFLAEGQRMSQTGTWCWNVSSGKLVWSEEQYRIFGFDPIEAQPTFQAVLDRIHPEDRPRFEQTRDQALCQGTGFTCEFRIVLPNGIVKHVQGVGRPTVSESGDADEYIGTTADITARKRVEEELRERANLLDLTRDTVFARDPRDVITFWNRGAEEQYGWTSEEAVGRVSHELLQTRFPAPLEEIMAELARVGRWEGELIHLRRNGVQVVVASRWALQLDDQGNPIAVLETNNDVTQRKQAEAEREARRAAEIANQAKSEFLARMSHELRTPLNGILGYAQILRRDRTLGERQLNGVAVIQQSGEHLLTLINDILDLSRIEAGKQDLNLADIPLHTLLRVVSDIIGVRAEQRRLGFVCEAGPDLPQRVRGDERRLRQVLLNLLANAVKFTDRGEVRLRVSFASPRRLRFEVRDTGVGISEDRREAIFQPFAQSGDKGRRTGGAGLGLSISRQLVRLMGGDIHVESRIGEGSTFWFELETSVVNAEIPDVLPERVVTGYLGPRRKILLVDDVAENRALMRDMLAHIGFEVLEAANGSEALEKCRILRPNLILMDTVMPGMDGLEATRRLRRSPDFAGTPIIAVSANASGENETLCLAAGVNAFLPKPLDVDRLMASIGDLLRLEWTYEQNGAELAQRTSSRPLLAPPAQEMETLHRLALLGNMRDIVQHASHLVELDGRYGAFAERLRVLAGGYQSKAILRFVEQHIERIHAP